MSRYNPDFNAVPVFETAEQWKEKCLLNGGSLFSDRNLWNLENIDELIKHFVNKPDEKSGGFWDKFENQLRPASKSAKIFASEIIYILYLPSCRHLQKTTLDGVNTIRGWADDEPIDINNSNFMNEILVGLGAGEPGFSRYLYAELTYFIRFLECFFKLSSIDEKRALLSDGRKLAEWMDETIPEEGSRQFRLMFLHILFPDEFERVFSYNSRRKIVNTFQTDRLGTDNPPECEIDRLLYRTREDLEREYGREIDFFEDSVRKMWDIDDTGPTGVAEEQNSYSDSKETTAEIPSEAVNLIYYGPPGTGKTYQLNKLKDEYVGRFKFITFHQAYSYEDFVEGIRPRSDKGSGTISYDVVPGVFRQICKDAESDSDNRYALFIDEINRGNIAKIFGDLITLIEPDKRLRAEQAMTVTLPYSNDEFGVPANLNIYGAMNTADRSIALLDKALRRRFRFFELAPDSDLIEGSDNEGNIEDGEGGYINLRQLLDSMNKRISFLLNRDLTLGHAYLCKVREFDELRDVFINQFIPLLQEYFYDDWRRIQLVFRDVDINNNPVEPQIIKHKEANKMEILGFDHEGFEDGISFSIAGSITANSIRKIYGNSPS